MMRSPSGMIFRPKRSYVPRAYGCHWFCLIFQIPAAREPMIGVPSDWKSMARGSNSGDDPEA